MEIYPYLLKIGFKDNIKAELNKKASRMTQNLIISYTNYGKYFRQIELFRNIVSAYVALNCITVLFCVQIN